MDEQHDSPGPDRPVLAISALGRKGARGAAGVRADAGTDDNDVKETGYGADRESA
ncbi:hypothetical protein GCM10028793_13840 [Nocardiopsis oceani]